MKLLFDQNLSPRLVDLLSDLYPNSAHVSLVERGRALDVALWNYASENGYTIVTKDADFDELSHARGYPPKIVWLRLGNCTTRQVEGLLRTRHAAVVALDADPDAGILELI